VLLRLWMMVTVYYYLRTVKFDYFIFQKVMYMHLLFDPNEDKMFFQIDFVSSDIRILFYSY